jgi:lantibiotic transport system ATP-binding protein
MSKQMGFPVIYLDDVWKSYGNVRAVRGIRLSVPQQSVYGFLGPNGAGKTTTIRLLLGLQRPDKGSINLFGKSLAAERLTILRRVGSLVDTPSLYTHLSGRENLEIHRRLLALAKSSIVEALEAVNLTSVADRLVRHYSHGMRQRLGMAIALLGRPELLVLDEPTNGLDPAGIHEMRALVRDLPKKHGVTVFLSSHLLSEVEQIATEVAIISHGEIQFEGTPHQLKMRSESIVIEVDQPERARLLLESAGLQARCEGHRLFVQPEKAMGSAEINSMLVTGHIGVSYLAVQGATLEDVFLQITSGLGERVEVSP